MIYSFIKLGVFLYENTEILLKKERNTSLVNVKFNYNTAYNFFSQKNVSLRGAYKFKWN